VGKRLVLLGHGGFELAAVVVAEDGAGVVTRSAEPTEYLMLGDKTNSQTNELGTP
jgi:hypothetical protein